MKAQNSDITTHQCRIVDVTHGKAFTVVEPVNLYSCRFGDNCFVGPFVEIQRNVTIGDNTRVQSHSFICEKVTVGDDCFIAHGVMFINDLFSDGTISHDAADWLPTVIGNRVNIGSNATILPVSICDDVVIGAGSVVVKDIEVPGVYAGNPARLLRRLPQRISAEA